MFKMIEEKLNGIKKLNPDEKTSSIIYFLEICNKLNLYPFDLPDMIRFIDYLKEDVKHKNKKENNVLNLFKKFTKGVNI